MVRGARLVGLWFPPTLSVLKGWINLVREFLQGCCAVLFPYTRERELGVLLLSCQNQREGLWKTLQREWCLSKYDSKKGTLPHKETTVVILSAMWGERRGICEEPTKVPYEKGSLKQRQVPERSLSANESICQVRTFLFCSFLLYSPPASAKASWGREGFTQRKQERWDGFSG